MMTQLTKVHIYKKCKKNVVFKYDDLNNHYKNGKPEFSHTRCESLFTETKITVESKLVVKETVKDSEYIFTEPTTMDKINESK